MDNTALLMMEKAWRQQLDFAVLAASSHRKLKSTKDELATSRAKAAKDMEKSNEKVACMEKVIQGWQLEVHEKDLEIEGIKNLLGSHRKELDNLRSLVCVCIF